MIKVQLWRSFSCNNSSSYYLVANFASKEAAESSAKELGEFFGVHAEQADALEDSYTTPTEAALALAKKHGFEWEGYLGWGDEGLSWWLPTVETFNRTVFISHPYCGGFGKSVPKFLQAVGATEVGSQQSSNPLVSIVFSIPEADKAKAAAAEIWAYVGGLREMAAEEEGWVFNETEPPAPWGRDVTEDMEYECGVPYPSFNDGESIGLMLEVTQMREWESITSYLESNGITDFSVGIDRAEDAERFRRINGPCPECQKTPLRFLDAAKHDAPTDQVACASCGGMFGIDDLIKKA